MSLFRKVPIGCKCWLSFCRFFFLLQWAPGWLSLQHPWIISLCIKWTAVPLIANQGRTGKPSLVPWLMIYTPLISSWADFHQGRGNSLLSISQAWFPSSTMVVRGAGGHHGQCSGGPWWQWVSHWWTAGQVESASTDSAVGKGDNLQKGFDLNCPVQSCGCAGSAWSSEHPSPGVAAFGDLPRSLPTMVGQADLCATALWLLTALICTLSSIHNYSWVRKIPECKDYMERISWKKKKKKKLSELSLCWGQAVVSFKKMFSLCVWTVLQIYFPSPSWMKVAGISTKYVWRSQAFNTSSFQSECWNDQ